MRHSRKVQPGPTGHMTSLSEQPVWACTGTFPSPSCPSGHSITFLLLTNTPSCAYFLRQTAHLGSSSAFPRCDFPTAPPDEESCLGALFFSVLQPSWKARRRGEAPPEGSGSQLAEEGKGKIPRV